MSQITLENATTQLSRAHSLSQLPPSYFLSPFFPCPISWTNLFHHIRKSEFFKCLRKKMYTLFDTEAEIIVLSEIIPAMVFHLQLFNSKNFWAFSLFSSWEKLWTIILAASAHRPQMAPSKPEIISWVLTAAFHCNMTSHCRLWK